MSNPGLVLIRHSEVHPKRSYRLRWPLLSVLVTLVLGYAAYTYAERAVTPPIGADIPGVINNWFKLRKRATSTSINWKSCGDGLLCGQLKVPLDYQNASAGKATLALAKFPATVPKKERLGTLFVNPGGPGASGVNFLYLAAKEISTIIGGTYDIVSWDPRGINNTSLRVDCFASQTDQDTFNLGVQYSDAQKLDDPTLKVVHAKRSAYLDAQYEVTAKLCSEKLGGNLDYVGTATVVRDLVRLGDVIDGPKSPIKFLGFSYGTAIGAYFVNMFPDRVGRVILDGNVDPDQWANKHASEWFKSDLVDIEKTLSDFVTSCAGAGPERCALANYGNTSTAIMAKLDGLLESLYERPLPVVKGASRPDILTAAILKGALTEAMNIPQSWGDLAKILAAAIEGDGSPILRLAHPPFQLNKRVRAETDSAMRAVVCTDSPPYPDNIDITSILAHDVQDDILTYAVAPHFAGVESFGCHHWKGRAKERFTGPFNSTLANPILVIGNTADPITPLKNAKATADRLGSSARLLVRSGSGHGSLSLPSLCVIQAMKTYLDTGVLPEPGLVCEPSIPPFAPQENAPIGASAKFLGGELSSEDDAVLESAKALGGVLGQQPKMNLRY